MKQKKLLLLFTVFLGIACFTSCSDDDKNITIISFNNILKEKNTIYKITDEEYEDATDPWGSILKHVKYSDKGKNIQLSYYEANWGFAGGFAYTNINDVTTAGDINKGAITGKGKLGDTYLTAYAGGNPTRIYIKNNELYSFKEVWITNATQVYLAIKDQNTGEGGIPVKKFEEGDYLKLIATGFNEEDKKINSLDFYLADYRDGKRIIIKDWTRFDLSSFHDAKYIEFTMDGSDKGDYGLNTPAYFCADLITLIEK